MTTQNQNRVFVVMGVSGSGKSVVASALAHQLGSTAFIDGDFLHSRANINKMSSGTALNDEDRASWLTAINDAAFAMQRFNAISLIVCSALKRDYRERLREGLPNLSFIYLKGQFEVIEKRLKARKGHFFQPRMLVSQFETLEEPSGDEPDVHNIDIDQPLQKVINDAIDWIRTATAVCDNAKI